MPRLRIVFAGTPAFAAVALEALLQSQHEILAVYTQPDKPSGRGLKLTPSAVKTLALSHQLPIYQPTTLKDPAVQAELKALNADVMVVAAYGMLLPEAVLNIPRHGCINIHPSLLPRWRGAAPLQRTIFAGDKITGVTIMQMDKGLDTGPMLLQSHYELADDETSQTLHDKMAKVGAVNLIETLNLLAQNKLMPQIQDDTLATYATKITKEEAVINWSQRALELEHLIRAFNPWPIAQTTWQGQPLRIWMAKALPTTASALPGTIVHADREGVDVATGEGILRLLQVQLPGSKAVSISDFYNARREELQKTQVFI
ncbi:MAG: methionyl-tRNA formyltransferase [Gammaproteobacteria bacterium]